jgi:hypothetical protein
MNLHDRVRNAIINAPLDGYISPADLHPPLGYRALDDDAPMHLDPYCHPDIFGEVSLDWLEFPDALYMLAEAHAEVSGYHKSDEDLQALNQHESEHMEVGKLLGASAVRISLRYTKPSKHSTYRNVTAVTRFPNLRTTRLGGALIATYPWKPSPGDIVNVNVLRYSGVKEVGRHVEKFNRSREDPAAQYPLPLSYHRHRFLNNLAHLRLTNSPHSSDVEI